MPCNWKTRICCKMQKEEFKQLLLSAADQAKQFPVLATVQKN